MYSDDIYNEDVLHIESAMQEAAELLASYSRIQGTVRTASEGLQLAQYELIARLATLEEDLNDFDERIRLAEGRNPRARVADPVVGYHRQYIHLARAEMAVLIGLMNPLNIYYKRGDTALASDACVAQKRIATMGARAVSLNAFNRWMDAAPVSDAGDGVSVASKKIAVLKGLLKPRNARRGSECEPLLKPRRASSW